MKIRAATKADIEQIIPLDLELERQHYVDLEKQQIDPLLLQAEISHWVKEWFGDPRSAVFVLTDEDKIAGFVHVELTPVIAKGRIEDIYVVPAYRGQGWGTKLMAQAYAWLKPQGVKRVDLEAHKQNQPALGFYNKEGFKSRAEEYLTLEKELE